MTVCKILLIASLAVLSTAAVASAEDADSYDVKQTASHPRFSYKYGVDAPSTGDSKNLTESRDGDVVQGAYNVVEPDGVIRTVTYTASDADGFRAVVEKSGTPTPAPSTPPKVVVGAYVPVYQVYAVPSPPAVAAYSVPVYPPASRSGNSHGLVYSVSAPVPENVPRTYQAPSYDQVPGVVAYGYVEPEPTLYSSFYRLPVIPAVSAYRYQPEVTSKYYPGSDSNYVKFSSPEVSYSY